MESPAFMADAAIKSISGTVPESGTDQRTGRLVVDAAVGFSGRSGADFLNDLNNDNN